jgi:CxxC motif-containing protein (DUF1111 family)
MLSSAVLAQATGVPSPAPSNFEGSAAPGVTDPGIRTPTNFKPFPVSSATTPQPTLPATGTTGGLLSNLVDTATMNFGLQAFVRFQEIDSVSGNAPGQPGAGLGPGFNSNSCASCHAFPAIGGSSPPTGNPQIAVATLQGATNTTPPFIGINTPVREARFIFVPGTTTPDGGVHDLFTITGRTDATNQPNANGNGGVVNTTCTLAQPNFAQAIAQNNIIFRIPIATFGDGLVESIGENTLMNTLSNNSAAAGALGISGGFNQSGNDGTITRFGWKAQNKSLLIFSGEAYNVEQGVTSELFPNERTGDNNCHFNATPEDTTHVTVAAADATNSPAADFSSDVVNFAAFMRLSSPPPQASSGFTATNGTSVSAASISAGLTAFNNIGCALCHNATYLTTAIPFVANSSKATFSPFSDFAVHDMGALLADGITQGNADGTEFRSAPLFGIGQRAFFLHDGRTSSLVTAIEDHASPGSEANAVIANFNRLPAATQQNIINFLRSL